MATLLYDRWRVANGKLYLTWRSLGNAVSFEGESEYIVEDVNMNRLVLRRDSQVFTYRRWLE